MGERKTCPACGCKFEHIIGPNGTAIPVQKVRTIYYVSDDVEVAGVLQKVPTPPGSLYVSHFETCSDPKRFSRAGRRRTQRGGEKHR